MTVSEEEVRVMMQEGVRAGAFNKVESQIVHSALELDQLPVREIMTPRPKVIWLNQDDPHDQIWHKIVVSNHSHFPVYEGNRDHTVGVVSVKAIYANLAAGAGVNLKDLMIPPLIVPESQTVLQLVETFKQSGKHIALVTDEFGSIAGLVTLNDVMEAVVGEFPTQGERAKPEAKKRDDGSWLIDAMIDLEAVERALPGIQVRRRCTQRISDAGGVRGESARPRSEERARRSRPRATFSRCSTWIGIGWTRCWFCHPRTRCRRSDSGRRLITSSAHGLSEKDMLKREYIVYDALYAECQLQAGLAAFR